MVIKVEKTKKKWESENESFILYEISKTTNDVMMIFCLTEKEVVFLA